MTKFTTAAVAALGLALVASTPAFADKAGGPDTQNPVPHDAVSVNGLATIQVWGGRGQHIEPTVLADSVTGTTSSDDVVATYNVGRMTYRVVRVHQSSENGTQVAKDEYIVFTNG